MTVTWISSMTVISLHLRQPVDLRHKVWTG